MCACVRTRIRDQTCLFRAARTQADNFSKHIQTQLKSWKIAQQGYVK